MAAKSRKLTRRSFIKASALTVAPAALILAGCAPTAPAAPTTATGPTAASAQPTAAQPTAAPAKIKPLIVVPHYGTDPETLDPHYGESATGMTVLNNVMETLVNYDRDLNIVPVLAESYEVLEDKVTWRFKLRQGVKFHNGEDFDAESVKFTVERTLNEELRAGGLNDPFPSRSGVEKVNIVDPYTVDLVLKDPNIVLPVFLTFLYMLPPKYYGSAPVSETSIKPVGTGPRVITEWVKGDHITFKKFEGYWRGDAGFDEFQFKPIPEPGTRLNMLLAGEADIIGGLAPEDIPQIEANPNLRIALSQGTRRDHIGIPASNPRYKSRAVRKALVQAIDRAGLAQAIHGAMDPKMPATVLVSGEAWLNKDIQPVEYDPDAAKKALQDEGFDFDEPVTVFGSGGGKTPEIVQAVAGYLRAIGINAEAQLLDWSVFTERMRAEKGIGDLYYLGLGSRCNGPEDVSIVTSGQIWDQTQWIPNTENGPKYEALYKELCQTMEDDKQHEMVNELQRLHAEEYVWATLWLQPVASGVNKRTDWEDNVQGGAFQFWTYSEEPTKVTD